MKLLEVPFLLISLVVGHDAMLPAGNITTHLPTLAHQCMSACVKSQQVSTQKINSINSCIVETCSLRDSPPELASYHVCRQNCMKFVNNGDNGTFPGILLTVGRIPLSDTRTREVNETLACIVKFLAHPNRWSYESISQFRQCVKPFQDNLTEPLCSAVNHFMDASEPLEQVHGTSSVSCKLKISGAVIVTIAIAAGTLVL